MPAAALLVVVLGAPPAEPQPGLYLTWQDCPTSPLATHDLTILCGEPATQQLVLALELSEPVDDVIALDAVVDVQSAAASLPAWWDYAPPDGCRYEKLTAQADFTGLSACADFWAGDATYGGPPGYYPGSPRGGAGQARILFSFAVLSSQSRALAAATRYYAARLQFQTDTGTECGGCDVPACLVLNSIRLVRPPDAPGGDVVIEAPGQIGANRATWQGTGADCSAVPARRRTWGALKALYR